MIKKPRKKVKSYIINDSVYGDFIIKYSDNPWWANKEKVMKLIQGYKMDCKPAELRILAGITERQLYDFIYSHRELCKIFDDFRKTPTLRARATLVRSVSEDPNIALKYLERKETEEFKQRSEITGKDGEKLIENPLSYERAIAIFKGKRSNTGDSEE